MIGRQAVINDSQSAPLAFAATSVFPTDLSKPTGAGHHVAHFRVGQIVAEEAREQRGLQAEQFHWQCIRKLRTLSRLGLRYAIAHRAKETILTVAVHVRCDTITGVIRPGCEAET